MPARFRVIGATGVEFPLEDVRAVVRALQTGQLTPDGLLFDVQLGRWAPAKHHDAVDAALAMSSSPEDALPLPVLDPRLDQLVDAEPQVTTHDLLPGELLSSWEAWIGPNWTTHYRAPITRMLAARRDPGNAGWTWNWTAALVPFGLWWVYRRLYGGFVLWGVMLGFLLAQGREIAAQGGDTTPILLLGLVLFVAMGAQGDRRLFARGRRYLHQIGSSATPQEIAAHGKPSGTAVAWVLGVWIGLGMLVDLMGG